MIRKVQSWERADSSLLFFLCLLLLGFTFFLLGFLLCFTLLLLWLFLLCFSLLLLRFLFWLLFSRLCIESVRELLAIFLRKRGDSSLQVIGRSLTNLLGDVLD